MKKIVIVFMFYLSCLGIVAQVQVIEKIASYNSWSVSADFGFSRFDGDINPKPGMEFQQFFGSVFRSPSLNVSIEHNIDPIFSVGWAIGANKFYQKGFLKRNTTDEHIELNSFSSSPYISTNVLKLIIGNRPTNLGVFFTAGVGFAGYSRQFTLMGNDTIVDFITDNQDRIKRRNMTNGVKSAEMSLMIPLGLSAEYNVNRNISVGAIARFVITNSDYLESISRNSNVDYWENLSVSVRYKFLRANQQHSRQVLYGQAPKSNTELIEMLRNDLDSLAKRMRECDCTSLDQLDNRLRGVEGQVPDPKVDNLEQRLRELEARKPQVQREPVRDTIVVMKEVKVEQPKPEQGAEVWPIPGVRLAVYFDFDKTDLNKEGLESIRKAAGFMKVDPTLKVEIRGYADNPGSQGYNLRLSQRRSDRVKAELVRVYGIDESRITTTGGGQVPDPPVKTRGNRRCDFIFSR
jgi:outer membrane protein OmpA-like peptidoglycan-associated protein